MGLLGLQPNNVDITEKSYYEGAAGRLGGYQFVTLQEIISQFLAIYVGQDKIIPKVKRADIQFHAMRALRELSFDTLKSFKSQQIELPSTLQMILPHDYVNYTKLSWVDSSGIKHPLYSTKHTNNPFNIKQDADGDYAFQSGENLVINGDFDNHIFGQGNWKQGGNNRLSKAWDGVTSTYQLIRLKDKIRRGAQDVMEFTHHWMTYTGNTFSHTNAAWQKIDVRNIRFLDFAAVGNSAGRQTLSTSGDLADYGVIRAGITTVDPDTGLNPDGSVGWAKPPSSAQAGEAVTANSVNRFNTNNPSPNFNASSYTLDYVEWNDGSTSEKTIEDVDVQDYDYVWVYIQSFVPWQALAIESATNVGNSSVSPTSSTHNTASKNTIDNISIVTSEAPRQLMHKNVNHNSDTWNNYKSTTPSENNNDDYQDDTYWPKNGNRYGLEPSHAQVNGSFFIDDLRGLIHFSSNISGKEVILDYISDSLGSDHEMVVHKFAEDAMYKHILCDVMSARANIGRNQLVYYKKDKFAAVRKAKLRLSNIKLEELTQILRGKSKQIKH